MPAGADVSIASNDVLHFYIDVAGPPGPQPAVSGLLGRPPLGTLLLL